MKQRLTLEKLNIYKEYLDTDMKIVVSNTNQYHCRWKAAHFECNFIDCRDDYLSAPYKIDRFVQLIRIGHCTCQACRHTIENESVVIGGIEKENVEKISIDKTETSVCGISLLHCLMMNDNNLPLIAFLKETGCDMKKSTLMYRHSPLALAVEEKQTEIVKYFVKHFDKQDFKSCFSVALWYAVLNKEPCLDIIEALLSARWIDPDFVFKVGQDTLLMKVLKNHGEERYDVLHALLKGGADANIKDSKGFSPIFCCISKKSTRLLQLFIDFGANVNQSNTWMDQNGNKHQTSPLLLAAEKNQYDLCQLLLVNGAHPEYLPWSRCGPLSLAVMNGSVALVKLMIRHGASLHRVDDTIGNTVVHDALHQSSLELLDTLLYANAPHDRISKNGYTPLMLTALFEKDTTIMKALLDHGCIVNRRNKYKDTALHCAAFMNLPNQVRLLIDYGAVPNHRNRVNATHCGMLFMQLLVELNGSYLLPM